MNAEPSARDWAYERLIAPLEPRRVSAPDDYAKEARGPVLAIAVRRAGDDVDAPPIGYLWFADEEAACGYLPCARQEPDCYTLSYAWIQWFRHAKAAGRTPAQALAALTASAPEDAGSVATGPVVEYGSLALLADHAAQ